MPDPLNRSWSGSSTPPSVIKTPLSTRTSLPANMKSFPLRPRLKTRTSFTFREALKEEASIDLGSPRPRVLNRSNSNLSRRRTFTLANGRYVRPRSATRTSIESSSSCEYPSKPTLSRRPTCMSNSQKNQHHRLVRRTTSTSFNLTDKPSKPTLTRRKTFTVIPKCKVTYFTKKYKKSKCPVRCIR